MSLQEKVKNKIKLNKHNIWELECPDNFAYSDGSLVENYLLNSVQKSTDLASDSPDLKKCIKDWPSEYHFSHKRAQLLNGFTYKDCLNVLEVGSGCGAISRYLSETFEQVISVDGSLLRTKIARQRTRDLPNIQFLVAPFDKIEFNVKFDLIFCIGVLEYSPSFICGENVFENALAYFSSNLSENGSLILAIENQFGLKYFCGANEDHAAIPYEGLEGYQVMGNRFRTFGLSELTSLLSKNFATIDKYYPFPDYKLPDCVVTEKFLESGRAGELISQNIRNKSKYMFENHNWIPEMTVFELEKNKMLRYFSNSFLMVANKSADKNIDFEQAGIIYTSDRSPNHRTITKIRQQGDTFIAQKTRVASDNLNRKNTPIQAANCESSWINSDSIETMLIKNCRKDNFTKLLAPAKIWLEELFKQTICDNKERYLDGRFIDNIWRNAYIDEGKCKFIDAEWSWQERLPFNYIIIRSIFHFLHRVDEMGIKSDLFANKSGEDLIFKIAEEIGVTLSKKDISEFINTESYVLHLVHDRPQTRLKISLYTRLRHRWLIKTSKFIQDGIYKSRLVIKQLANNIKHMMKK